MVHRSESELILDEIVFDGRNQEYGAFELRKFYNIHLIRSVLAGLFIFSLALFSPQIIELFTSKEAENENIVITEVTLEQPPPLNENEPPPPPPPPVEAPKIATTKFLPPVIKKDEDVLEEEAPPVVEEIKGNTAAVTQEGIVSDEVPVEAPNTEVGEKTEEAVLWVAEKQTFKGGDIMKFLGKEIRYPAQAQNNNVAGRVIVEFIIEKDGSVSNVKAVRGIGSGCDEEAERVIKLTNGLWNPGKNNGHPVRLKMMQPIFFKLPEE
ncbi:MAG: energy transducer TonB [Cytophagales bacterium]|nr:MAG: energy transducer TonB [Cytophagales bacterium]